MVVKLTNYEFESARKPKDNTNQPSKPVLEIYNYGMKKRNCCGTIMLI